VLNSSRFHDLSLSKMKKSVSDVLEAEGGNLSTSGFGLPTDKLKIVWFVKFTE